MAANAAWHSGNIDHIFAGEIFQTAVDFYTNKLGFSLVFTWGEPPTIAGVKLDNERVMMRIAVSGTHAVGKSTLAEDFVENHPEFVLEVEPYHILQEQDGIAFAAEPTQESFIIQLEYSLERINTYEMKDNVIFDRCPLDYIAYLMYVSKRGCGATSCDHVNDLIRKAAKSIERLELIAFLPIDDGQKIMPGSDEDENFRLEVDRYFKQIYRDDSLGIFSGRQPEIVELWGNRQRRLARLESRLKSYEDRHGRI